MELSTGISLVALVVAAIALGWNIYRDVILKARVSVRLAVVSVVSRSSHGSEGPSFVRLLVTNLGPGPVQLRGIAGQVAPWWRRVIRRPKHVFVLQDDTNPLSTRLPCRLEVGEDATILLPHEERSFLGSDVTHIGVLDSFGRTHFAPSSDVRDSRVQYEKEFGASKGKK